jgi:hypothetical protein
MKRSDWLLAGILLINVFIFLYFLWLQKSKAEKDIKASPAFAQTDESQPESDYLFHQLASRNQYSWKDNGRVISLLHGNRYAVMKSLDSLKKVGKSLFFRFSSYTCTGCQDSLLQLLHANQVLWKDDIVLLLSFARDREMQEWMNEHGLEYESLNLKEAVFNLEAENAGAPYFFRMNGREVSDVFVPLKSVAELSRQYVEIMRTKPPNGFAPIQTSENLFRHRQ